MASKINLQETIIETAGQSVYDISPCPSSKSELMVYLRGSLLPYEKYSLNNVEYKVTIATDMAETITVGDLLSFVSVINYDDTLETPDESIMIYSSGFRGAQIDEKTITHKHIADGTINANNINIFDPQVGMVTRLVPGTGIKIISPPGVPTGMGSCRVELTISAVVDELILVVESLDSHVQELHNNLWIDNITVAGEKTFSDKIILGQYGIMFYPTKTKGQFYTENVVPDSISLLNYDGYFRATRLFADKIILTNGVQFPVTKLNGQFYTGNTAPDNNSLLNFDGHLRATKVIGHEVNATGSIIFPAKKAPAQFYTNTASGTPNGTTPLFFDGYLKATKVYNAVYNDIAEGMPSDGGLEPGDFAMIDKSHPTFRLTRYTHTIENMSLFMGIVSENPGFVVGDNPEYEHQVYLILKGMIDIPFSKIGQSFDVENFAVGDDLIIARDRSYQKIIGKIIEINKIKNTVKVFI